MNKLLTTLIAMAFTAAGTGTVLAADDVKSGGKTTDAQGRTVDEVKAGKKTTDAQGRALDDVKAGGKTTDAQGRTLDEKKKSKKKKPQG